MFEDTNLAIFLSHSSRDTELAKALIELFRAAFSLRASQIRCTSVSGYKLDAGADTNEQLRRETVEATVLVGLITDVSIDSAYVLFELGARWGAKKYLAPLLGAGRGPEILAGPLAGINAMTCTHQDLFQLVSNIATQLGILPEMPNVYSEGIDQVVAVSLQLAVQRGLNAAKAEKTRPDDNDNGSIVNMSDFECDYLMLMSRPRNNGAIYGGIDDHEGREVAAYQDALEHFQSLTVVNYKGGSYRLTRNGWKLTDQLWELKILDALFGNNMMSDKEVAVVVELNSDEAELKEVRRHFASLEQKQLVKTTQTRGGWHAWITPAGETHQKHRPLSIQSED